MIHANGTKPKKNSLNIKNRDLSIQKKAMHIPMFCSDWTCMINALSPKREAGQYRAANSDLPY